MSKTHEAELTSMLLAFCQVLELCQYSESHIIGVLSGLIVLYAIEDSDDTRDQVRDWEVIWEAWEITFMKS